MSHPVVVISSVSTWTTLGATIIGGLIAGVAAFGSITVTQRREDQRAIRADKQRLRDAKAERLRALYEPIMEVVLVLTRIAHERAFVLEVETEQERDQRHLGAANRVMAKVQGVLASLEFEPGTSEVRIAYNNAFSAGQDYLMSLEANKRHAGSIPFEQVMSKFAAVQKAGDEFLAAVTAQLEHLERPI